MPRLQFDVSSDELEGLRKMALEAGYLARFGMRAGEPAVSELIRSIGRGEYKPIAKEEGPRDDLEAADFFRWWEERNPPDSLPRTAWYNARLWAWRRYQADQDLPLVVHTLSNLLFDQELRHALDIFARWYRLHRVRHRSAPHV